MSDWATDYFEHGYAQRWGVLPVTERIRHDTACLWSRLQLILEHALLILVAVMGGTRCTSPSMVRMSLALIPQSTFCGRRNALVPKVTYALTGFEVTCVVLRFGAVPVTRLW